MKYHRLAGDDRLPDGYQMTGDEVVGARGTFGEVGAEYEIDWEIGTGIDIFAFEAGGYCNGPRCLDCGKAKCQHCDKGWAYRKDCNG